MKLPWATWTKEHWWYFGLFGALLILWLGIVYIRSGPNLSGVRRAGSSRVSRLWRAIQGRVDAPSCPAPRQR